MNSDQMYRSTKFGMSLWKKRRSISLEESTPRQQHIVRSPKTAVHRFLSIISSCKYNVIANVKISMLWAALDGKLATRLPNGAGLLGWAGWAGR